MKKITIGEYNRLYSIAEEGLQSSWQDLGISLDGIEIEEKLKNNSQIQELKKDSSLPASYFLYKKNANIIVDRMLKALGIEVE